MLNDSPVLFPHLTTALAAKWWILMSGYDMKGPGCLMYWGKAGGTLNHSLRDTCSSNEACETVGLCTERDSMRGEWYRGRFRALKIQPERECGVHACMCVCWVSSGAEYKKVLAIGLSNEKGGNIKLYFWLLWDRLLICGLNPKLLLPTTVTSVSPVSTILELPLCYPYTMKPYQHEVPLTKVKWGSGDLEKCHPALPEIMMYCGGKKKVVAFSWLSC